jgi:hypothetical protein
MTKWLNGAEKMWARRGVTIVPYPFELTKAGGGGGEGSVPYTAETIRRVKFAQAAKCASPAYQATKALIKAGGFKGLSPGLTGDVNVYGAPHGGKFIGTFTNVFAGAAARNAYTGALPGDIDHNKEFFDEDGAPMEFSRGAHTSAEQPTNEQQQQAVGEADAELHRDGPDTHSVAFPPQKNEKPVKKKRKRHHCQHGREKHRCKDCGTSHCQHGPLHEPEGVDVVEEEEAAAKRAEEKEAAAKRAEEEEAAAKRAEEEEAAAKRVEEEEAAAKRVEEEEAAAKRAEEEEAAAKRVEEQIAEEQRVEAEMAEEQRQFEAELLAEKQALEERHRVRVVQQKQKQDARKAALRAA